jgi:hypothetical protein
MLSTNIRVAVNSVLKNVGLKVETTRAETAETLRLEKLKSARHWDTPKYSAGVNLNSKSLQSFLTSTVAQYTDRYAEFQLDDDPTGKAPCLNNEYFGGIDSEVLYAVVSRNRPKTIIEVGSGYSTRVIAKAIADQGLTTKLISIDPFPRAPVAGIANERLSCMVEALPATSFADQLSSGDILFIDSSHTVTTGGDVPFLFLEVLPRLAQGVIVHIHDVFLPFDYPKEWIVDFRWRWTEQYLVHAFLCNNSAFEIIWASQYMWREFKQDVLHVIPRGATAPLPTSLWLKRIN